MEFDAFLTLGALASAAVVLLYVLAKAAREVSKGSASPTVVQRVARNLGIEPYVTQTFRGRRILLRVSERGIRVEMVGGPSFLTLTPRPKLGSPAGVRTGDGVFDTAFVALGSSEAETLALFDDEKRRGLLRSLGGQEFRFEKGVLVFDALTDSEEQVRQWVLAGVDALGVLEKRASAPIVTRLHDIAIEDELSSVRARALVELLRGFSEWPEAEEARQLAMKDVDPDVRRLAAAGLEGAVSISAPAAETGALSNAPGAGALSRPRR